MRVALDKRLGRLEDRLKPSQVCVATIGGMNVGDMLSRLSSSELDELRSALRSATENDDECAFETIRALILLAQDRKEAGLIVMSGRKAPEEYKEELRAARRIHGPEAWRHVSMRFEVLMPEAEAC